MKHSNITRKLVRLALAAMTLPLFACMASPVMCRKEIITQKTNIWSWH